MRALPALLQNRSSKIHCVREDRQEFHPLFQHGYSSHYESQRRTVTKHKLEMHLWTWWKIGTVFRHMPHFHLLPLQFLPPPQHLHEIKDNGRFNKVNNIDIARRTLVQAVEWEVDFVTMKNFDFTCEVIFLGRQNTNVVWQLLNLVCEFRRIICSDSFTLTRACIEDRQLWSEENEQEWSCQTGRNYLLKQQK